MAPSGRKVVVSDAAKYRLSEEETYYYSVTYRLTVTRVDASDAGTLCQEGKEGDK